MDVASAPVCLVDCRVDNRDHDWSDVDANPIALNVVNYGLVGNVQLTVLHSNRAALTHVSQPRDLPPLDEANPLGWFLIQGGKSAEGSRPASRRLSS